MSCHTHSISLNTYTHSFAKHLDIDCRHYDTSLLNILACFPPEKGHFTTQPHHYYHTLKKNQNYFNLHFNFPKISLLAFWFFKSRIQSKFMYHWVWLLCLCSFPQFNPALCFPLCMTKNPLYNPEYSISGFMWPFLLD